MRRIIIATADVLRDGIADKSIVIVDGNARIFEPCFRGRNVGRDNLHGLLAVIDAEQQRDELDVFILRFHFDAAFLADAFFAGAFTAGGFERKPAS